MLCEFARPDSQSWIYTAQEDHILPYSSVAKI